MENSFPGTCLFCPQTLDEFAAEHIVNLPRQVATITRYSAVCAGDTLGADETQAIISQLTETAELYRNLNGEATIVQVSKLQLEPEFRRR